MHDENAFREVVSRTHATVFRVASALVGDRDEADDVTQETYVRAWDGWGELRDPAAALPWLVRIARNVAHDRRRSWWSRVSARLDPATAHAGEDEGVRPDAALAAEQDRASVRRALQALPEKQRVVVALRELEGFSYEEIAAVLEIPVGTVESRLHRGRAALAERLRSARLREERP